MTNFFLTIIKGIYGFTETIGMPSHGLTIVLIALLIKTVLFPLTRMQVKSMKAMQDLQPKLDKLKKQYANDKEKLNVETANLYKENKVNPMASCLPLLIQFPIIIGLFQAMRAYFVPELGASFLWLPNLGEPDLWVLPILAGLSTFVQQKVTMSGQSQTGSAASQQKTMLYIMPVFMAWISRSFPAGLALYWFCYNVISTFEQLVIHGKIKLKRGEGTAK
jgi:YidC/Oxa1 family membrane protein insertase